MVEVEIEQQVQDFVSLQDYEDAISLLRNMHVYWLKDGRVTAEEACREGVIGEFGVEKRHHAIDELKRKLANYFNDSRIPRDQQQFMAMMKKMALGYQEDAQALSWAAARLKNKHHDIHGASETHKAALIAARAAQELIGEDG